MSDPFFPFHRLGLHRNPFGTLSPEEQMAVTVPPPAIEQALARGFEHLLVLGRKGRGKSTTLNYLRYHFMMQRQHVAYERIPRWQWRYTTHTAPLDVFALDEVQRLAPWQIGRLFAERDRYHLRLIVGSHRDHTLEFRVRGLDVVTVRLSQQMTRARLGRVLARRLAVFALDEEPGVWFTDDAVDVLWRRYGTDLRHMNFHLYDVFQRIEQPGPIGAKMIVNSV